MSRRIVLAAAALYAVFIVGVVTVADLGGTDDVFGFLRAVPLGDKLGHFLLIGGLALAADLAWRRDLRLGRLRLPAAALVVAGLALAEELTQLALPTRTFDVGDLSADLLGIGCFVALGRALGRRRPSSPPRPGTDVTASG